MLFSTLFTQYTHISIRFLDFAPRQTGSLTLFDIHVYCAAAFPFLFYYLEKGQFVSWRARRFTTPLIQSLHLDPQHFTLGSGCLQPGNIPLFSASTLFHSMGTRWWTLHLHWQFRVLFRPYSGGMHRQRAKIDQITGDRHTWRQSSTPPSKLLKLVHAFYICFASKYPSAVEVLKLLIPLIIHWPLSHKQAFW